MGGRDMPAPWWSYEPGGAPISRLGSKAPLPKPVAARRGALAMLGKLRMGAPLFLADSLSTSLGFDLGRWRDAHEWIAAESPHDRTR
jgi:hypothetical protein